MGCVVVVQVKALVEESFKSKGISIVKEGTLDGTTIGEEKLIDNHYYAIANKAYPHWLRFAPPGPDVSTSNPGAVASA